jgi:pseudouridine kinase
VFGGDELASHLIEGCRRVGIEAGRSLTLPSAPTPRYVCLLDADGSLVGAVAAMEALDGFGPSQLEARYGPGDEAEVVVIDANLPADTIAAAARRWRGKPLILDTVSVAKAARAAPVVGDFYAVKPNRKEARVLLGLDPDADGKAAGSGLVSDTGGLDPDAAADGGDDALGSAEASASGLLSLGLREVFVSLGERGLLWACPAGMGVARPLPLPVVNVSGAGDAATAALAWAQVRGLDCMMKASYAVAAASLCASSPDAVFSGINQDVLKELAQGVRNERIS